MSLAAGCSVIHTRLSRRAAAVRVCTGLHCQLRSGSPRPGYAPPCRPASEAVVLGCCKSSRGGFSHCASHTPAGMAASLSAARSPCPPVHANAPPTSCSDFNPPLGIPTLEPTTAKSAPRRAAADGAGIVGGGSKRVVALQQGAVTLAGRQASDGLLLQALPADVDAFARRSIGCAKQTGQSKIEQVRRYVNKCDLAGTGR